MAITPNYRKFTPIQVNQAKKMEVKPQEDTSSLQNTTSNINTSDSTNGNNKSMEDIRAINSIIELIQEFPTE